MNALPQRLELVLEPLGDDLEAECRKCQSIVCRSQPLGPADLRVLGRDEARQVDGEVRLERRVLEQVRHHHLRVGVLLELQLDPHVVGRDVLDVQRAAAACATATTSAMRSTSAALFTVYGMLVM